MLIENGGHIQLTLAWAYSLLQRMGFVQRKATTKTKTSLSKSEFELAKKSYLKRIKKAVADAKIPAELVINWDQTGVNVVPASQWTQEEKGSSRVEVAGVGDQRQIMVTVAGTLSGKLLPFQVLYEGKTERCHPSTAFPKGSISGTLPIIGLMVRQASDLSRISFFRTFLQHARILD